MNCEIIRSGNVIAGPLAYEQKAIENIVARQGGDIRLIPARLVGAITVGSIVIKPVVENKPTLTVLEKHRFDSRVENENNVVYAYTKSAKTVDEVKTTLLNALSGIHRKYKDGYLTYEGVLVRANPDSLALLANAKLFYDGGTVIWRCKTPPTGQLGVPDRGRPLACARLTLTSQADIDALYAAVSTYINAGVLARNAIEDVIESATLVELGELDIAGEFKTRT